MQKRLDVYNNGPILYLTSAPIHLRGVDHQAALVATRAAHDPLPQYSMNTVPHHVEMIPPSSVWDEIPKGAAGWTREKSLISKLHVVEEDRFLSIAPVNVAENVKTGLDAPDFFQKLRVTKTEIHVMFLRQDKLAVSAFHENSSSIIPEDNESREYQSAGGSS